MELDLTDKQIEAIRIIEAIGTADFWCIKLIIN